MKSKFYAKVKQFFTQIKFFPLILNFKTFGKSIYANDLCVSKRGMKLGRDRFSNRGNTQMHKMFL